MAIDFQETITRMKTLTREQVNVFYFLSQQTEKSGYIEAEHSSAIARLHKEQFVEKVGRDFKVNPNDPKGSKSLRHLWRIKEDIWVKPIRDELYKQKAGFDGDARMGALEENV